MEPDIGINFQPGGVATPEGYIADMGAAYNASRGYGWVTQASLGQATPTPIDIAPNARDRNAVDDQRQDTLLHMQFPTNIKNSSAVKTPAAWEYDLLNGTYEVTVGVGDPTAFDSTHEINIEGLEAINFFVPTAADPFEQATVPVEVTDGKLTIDAIGGSNTKINYVEIVNSDSPNSNPEIEIENLDGVPYSDRLVFSRIGSLTSPPANGVHDVVTLRVKNTGSDPLQISDLAVTGPWEVDTAAPTTIAAGDQLDLPVRFTATSGDVRNGTLTIASNDADEPNTVVQLSGF